MTTPLLPLHLPSNSGCTNLLAYHHHLGKEVTNRWVMRHLLLRPSAQTVYRYKKHKTSTQYYTKSVDHVLFALYHFLRFKRVVSDFVKMWYYQNISLFNISIATSQTQQHWVSQWYEIEYHLFRASSGAEITHYTFTFELKSWKMVVSNFHHHQLIFSKQCSLALLPATEGISQPMTMTVMGSNSISTTGRPKGMYIPSQTPPLLPKVHTHTEM